MKWNDRLERRTLTLTIAERPGRVDHLVSDSSDQSEHYTTGYSCDCGDFVRRGPCLHHTFLLDSLGWSAAPSAAVAGTEVIR